MSDRLSGIDGFVDDIARWRQAVGTRAPPYHRLLHELVALLESETAAGAELADRLREAWASRTFRVFYDRPLLFLAALRMDAIVAGARHPLWSALAAPEPDPDSVRREKLLEALASDSFWASLRAKFVQTNETSRAVAWLWPAQIIGCGEGLRPLVLVEVGTAAGLNLVADQLPSPWTTAAGVRVPTARAPDTVARLGIDANPLDARSDGDANWLRACVWVGEHERIARLEAAIAAFRASPARLETGDVSHAPAKLRALSAERQDRTVVLAFQTIVRDYLEPHTRVAYEQGMKRWLEDSAVASAVWVELEIDHDDPGKRVPIVAHVREGAGSIDIVLGITGYHPSTVVVDAGSVARLARIFG
jgi:hypothetical protein